MTETPDNIRILNEKLGITERENLFNSAGVKSIEDMLASSRKDFELLCESIANKKKDVEDAERSAKEHFDVLSAKGGDIQSMESAAAAMSQFNTALSSMMMIVDRGNEMIRTIYEAVASTNIIDPDLLDAAASLIHSIRETNDNLIQFNLQKFTLEQQYRLAVDMEKLKQKHRLETEFFKWQLRQKELENKARLKAEMDAAGGEVKEVKGRVWSQSDVVEALRSGKELT